MSLLHNNRFIKSYHLHANYDLTYVQNIQRKLEYIKKIKSTRGYPEYTHANLCGFVFHVNFAPVSWIMISCNDVLMPNYFLCENNLSSSNLKNQPYLLKRVSYHCRKWFTYIKGVCFKTNRISNWEQVNVDLPYISFNYTSISSYLTAWSIGNYKRKDIVLRVHQTTRECLSSVGFPYQRLKMWHRTSYMPCQYTNYTLSIRGLQNNKQGCNIDRHHKCSDDTCILTSYVCDGNHDCLNGSDEIVCESTCDNSTDCSGQCFNKSSLCTKLQYQCLSGEQIALTHVCDWNAHCSDNSDESRCNTVSDIYSNSLDLLTIETTISKVNIKYLLVS